LMHWIFIGVSEGPAPGYPQRLAEHLRTELSRHRVSSTLRIVRAGTVNRKDLAIEVARAKPEGLLTIHATHGVTKRGVPIILTYEAILTDAKRGDSIWNAKIEVRRANEHAISRGGIRNSVEQAARTISLGTVYATNVVRQEPIAGASGIPTRAVCSFQST